MKINLFIICIHCKLYCCSVVAIESVLQRKKKEEEVEKRNKMPFPFEYSYSMYTPHRPRYVSLLHVALVHLFVVESGALNVGILGTELYIRLCLQNH